MFQANVWGLKRLAAGLLLVPGLTAIGTEVLLPLNVGFAQERSTTSGTTGSADKAEQMMKQARVAYDRGDYEQAADLCRKVKAMNVVVPFWSESSPDQMLADIAKKSGKNSMAAGPSLPLRPTQEDPHLLVKKARQELDLGHLDVALQLARQADANGKTASWGLFEESPASLLKDVQKAQAKQHRAEADRMLAQSRSLFEKKARNDEERAANLDKAKTLAKQSEALHGEYSMWDLGDRPASLVKEIDAARMKIKVPIAKKPATNPKPTDFDPRSTVLNKPDSTGKNPSLGMGNDPKNTGKPSVMPVDYAPPLDPPGTSDPKSTVVSKPMKQPVFPPLEEGGLVIPEPMGNPGDKNLVMPGDLAKPVDAGNEGNLRKAQAVKLMQQAQARKIAGQFSEAKELYSAAQKQNAIFTMDEISPDQELMALNAAALKKMQSLCREAHECIIAKDAKVLGDAEKKLHDAEVIALSMSLDGAAIQEHREMLMLARTSLGQPMGTPTQTVGLPMQNPDLMLPGEKQPVQADPGKVLLMQARVEISGGHNEIARKIVSQVLNGPYTCKKEAEDLLRSLDGEELVQKQKAASRAYENAVTAYQQQNFEQAVAIFKMIDPSLLNPTQRSAMNDLTVAGTRYLAAKDASKATIVRASGSEPRSSEMPADLPETTGNRTGANSLLEQQAAMQQVVFQKLRAEGLKVESDATARFGKGETDAAMQDLQNFVAKVKQANLDASKVALLTRPIETRMERLKVLKHQTDFLTKEARDLRNFKAGMNQDALHTQHKQEQVAALVKDFHRLVDEGKYQEANKLALQARELDPDNPVPQALLQMSKMMYRSKEWDRIKSEQENWNYESGNDVWKFGPPVDVKSGAVAFDKDRWKAIQSRPDYSSGLGSMRNRSPKEHEIESTLQSTMLKQIDFRATPLDEVVRTLQVMTKMNVVLDRRALEQKNIPVNTPVTQTLNDISMKSAINIIVDQVGLKYIVENDALKITTPEGARGRLVSKVISVADLVVPVHNFAPPSVERFEDQLARMNGLGNRSIIGNTALPYTPAMGLPNGVSTSPTGSGSLSPGSPGSGRLVNEQRPSSASSGFDKMAEGATIEESLIRLITNSVKPDTWAAVGGSGTIQYYPTSLALVINQTPDVQNDVEVLLEQLRRLQDLEIAVEIRMISLSEQFYERIGVDFSMNLATHNTPKTQNAIITGNFTPSSVINTTYAGIKGAVLGLQAPGVPTADLNLPIHSSSYTMAVPPFGGYNEALNSNGGLSLGLAFLNDIQVSMFLEAAQGDQRTNVMQAPKLTMFNGQTATISIQDQQFFLTGIQAISVNGQLIFNPQNDTIPLGASMTLQTVVTGDRRFVRVNIGQRLSNLSSTNIPLFPVTTFITPTFEGGFQGQPIPFTQFVQQPTFASINVQTTVVVPDGGTVLLGGLKTLSEGRNEFGPPVLSKIPYINRLFKNVGYGREARSVMMMVTPRIIINREEEKNQTGLGGDNDNQ